MKSDGSWSTRGPILPRSRAFGIHFPRTQRPQRLGRISACCVKVTWKFLRRPTPQGPKLRATKWRQRVAHGVSRGQAAMDAQPRAGRQKKGLMSGSFAAPRLLFFNAAPHGSRRGLLSSAAPQLTASTPTRRKRCARRTTTTGTPHKIHLRHLRFLGPALTDELVTGSW